MGYLDAREVARPLFRALSHVSLEIQAVGELRRQSDSVSVIEFLMLPKVDINDVRTVVHSWNGTSVQSTDNAICVRLHSGQVVTVWLCEDQTVFGVELLVRTGPAPFIDSLLGRLAKNNISMDLDTFRVSRGQATLPVSDESAVFHMAGLGLPVPPELREDFDVWEN